MTEELERGRMLGKYEIHGRLSTGGMAELYLASLAGQGGFRKFVALKRVLPSIARDEAFTRMFLDEARITASLTHASIAQVYELAENPETHEPMLAMEYIAGQNLEQIVKRARLRTIALPPEFTCRLAHQVLLALHSAHAFIDPATGQAMAVVHRDINPRNVMVTYTGSTKVVDFGIAKARGRLSQTQVGFVKGTLQYMAPEQVTAKSVDGRTDLFAASILFYELLAGRRLFDSPSDGETMTRVATSDVPDLAQVAPSLPRALTDAVMKGLQRLPEHRWQAAREYARAVDRAFPEAFDDQQVGELMGRLFDDKIAMTRALLTSSAQATVADLSLMMRRDSEPHLAPVTTPGRRPQSSELTELDLEPVPLRSVSELERLTLDPAPVVFVDAPVPDTFVPVTVAPIAAPERPTLEPVPVLSFRSPRRNTPAWLYVMGALTVLAGLFMLAMLVLVLTTSPRRGRGASERTGVTMPSPKSGAGAR